MPKSNKENPWKIPGFKAGQSVKCRICNSEAGGYAVTVLQKDIPGLPSQEDRLVEGLPGFLPTEKKFEIGSVVEAAFVCVSNSRILLSFFRWPSS